MCNYYYPSRLVRPLTTPSIPLPTTSDIPLPTTPNILLPQSIGSDSFYFLLPSGQIIKRTILSVSPIEKYKWKVQFIDSQEIVIINNEEDYLALTKMLIYVKFNSLSA